LTTTFYCSQQNGWPDVLITAFQGHMKHWKFTWGPGLRRWLASRCLSYMSKKSHGTTHICSRDPASNLCPIVGIQPKPSALWTKTMKSTMENCTLLCWGQDILRLCSHNCCLRWDLASLPSISISQWKVVEVWLIFLLGHVTQTVGSLNFLQFCLRALSGARSPPVTW
jgi:hypothetical protein